MGDGDGIECAPGCGLYCSGLQEWQLDVGLLAFPLSELVDVGFSVMESNLRGGGGWWLEVADAGRFRARSHFRVQVQIKGQLTKDK